MDVLREGSWLVDEVEDEEIQRKGVQAEGISPALSDVYTVCSRSPGWLEQGD